MPNKQKPIISIEDTPIIITVVVFVIGLGTILALLGYCIFGINKYAKPTIKAPSINVVESNYFGNKFIQVKSPQRNATVKSPMLISGKANVFEANVRVRMKDDNENILADTFITASGAYDKLYPFEKEIEYIVPSSQNGFIEVFEESAKDGSDLHKVVIPVVFGDYADVLDWKTYRNEEYGFEFKYPKDWTMENLQTASVLVSVGLNTTGYIRKPDTDQPNSANFFLYESVAKLDLKKISPTSLKDYLDRYSALSDPVYENVIGQKIGNLDGYTADAGSNQFDRGKYFFTELPNKQIVIFWLFNERANREIMNKILSTFKFVEK